MSGFSEFERFDGVALAQLVRQREVSPEELLEASIACVEARNPVVNAVVSRLYDEARAAIKAGLPAGPFTGVPYLLKDLGALYNGAITSSGSRLFADDRADHDSEITARLKRAGLVIFGKTNTPELGFCPSTEPRLFGATRNPMEPRVQRGRVERRGSGGRGLRDAADGARDATVVVPFGFLHRVAASSDSSPRAPATHSGLTKERTGAEPRVRTRSRAPCATVPRCSMQPRGRTSATPTGRHRLPGRSCKRSDGRPGGYGSPLRLSRGMAPRLIPSAARQRAPLPHCARASAIASKRHVPRSTPSLWPAIRVIIGANVCATLDGSRQGAWPHARP